MESVKRESRATGSRLGIITGIVAVMLFVSQASWEAVFLILLSAAILTIVVPKYLREAIKSFATTIAIVFAVFCGYYIWWCGLIAIIIIVALRVHFTELPKKDLPPLA